MRCLYHENPYRPGKWCLVVPKEMRSRTLHETHGSRFTGHYGERSLRFVEKILLVGRYEGRCATQLSCISSVCFTKGNWSCIQTPSPANPGQPILKVINMQWSFLDYLTKWAEVFPASDQTAQTVAKLFVEGVMCRHGAPQEILSDRDPSFLSEFFLEVCRLLEVKKVNTLEYHPQTDGLVERFNATLTDMIAKTTEKHGHDWDCHLPYFLYAILAVCIQNHSAEFHEGISFLPFIWM